MLFNNSTFCALIRALKDGLFNERSIDASFGPPPGESFLFDNSGDELMDNSAEVLADNA